MTFILLWIAGYCLVTSVTTDPNNRMTPDVGEPCECVPYKRCGDPNVITDGTGIIQLRIGGSKCKKSLEVCCKNPLKSDVDVKPRMTKKEACGKRNADGISIKITGNESQAQFAEFPWMVMLLEKVTVGKEVVKLYDYGGSLIHEKVVLTAAHSVARKSKDSIIVRAGDWDHQHVDEPYPHQDRQVAQVIIHEAFDKDSLENDIALLVVSTPFTFTDNVQLVCLPRPNDIVLDTNCWASGWGRDTFIDQEGTYQTILKKVQLSMVPRERCEADLRATSALDPEFSLHESFVCAGGKMKNDTCKGDGGSPLICPIKSKLGQYQQVGVVSWGVKCGTETPAAYVNVAMYKNWISKKMEQLGLKTAFDY